jgi:hypothetical protein
MNRKKGRGKEQPRQNDQIKEEIRRELGGGGGYGEREEIHEDFSKHVLVRSRIGSGLGRITLSKAEGEATLRSSDVTLEGERARLIGCWPTNPCLFSIFISVILNNNKGNEDQMMIIKNDRVMIGLTLSIM